MSRTRKPSQLNKLKARWFVVANRTEASIYAEGRGRRLSFLQRLSNPDGDLSPSELESDRPGRAASSAARGTIRHALEKRSGRYERVAEQFAGRIAAALKTAHGENRYGGLVLVAEPRFLGLMRRALPANLRRLVEHEVVREFREGSDRQIRTNILRALDEAA